MTSSIVARVSLLLSSTSIAIQLGLLCPWHNKLEQDVEETKLQILESKSRSNTEIRLALSELTHKVDLLQNTFIQTQLQKLSDGNTSTTGDLSKE